MPVLRFALLCLLPLLLAPAAARALQQESYIWQRKWTPELARTASQAAPLLQGWRVLAGEFGWGGYYTAVAPDFAALRAMGRPARPVLRIEGSQLPPVQAVAEQVARILSAWRAAGLEPNGIEIDCDVATARLPFYAAFLRQLRTQLPADTRLAVTALPTWLGDAESLRGLLAEADESVLQVHAVQNPGRGLFDAELARRWAEAWAKHTEKLWFIALPTYGSRVSLDASGNVVGIASERGHLVGGSEVRELAVSPERAAAFRDALYKAPPRGLAGIVWFRLPLAGDQRAWSLRSFHAVLRGEPLQATIVLRLRQKLEVGTDHADMFLVNEGNADAPLPARLRLQRPCAALDAVNGYRLEQAAGGIVLRRTDDGLLRAGMARPIGWLRCAVEQADWLVEQEG
ncbi:DUF3142 domain-containing protein [Ferrovibrio sp.]|uniref:DUF3142 domain-containing protein n=1 Tax=Ferrovibrio sp. TaxID=1917215 RepID=UPI003D2A03B9